LARLLGDPARLSFLDVGCGIGTTDEHLVDRVGNLHGVDVSPAMVERAAARNPSASYTVGDGRTLPFEDREFDVSFAVCVLHHIEPDQRSSFLVEVARVTRRNGLVLVLEHNPHNPLTRRAVASCSFDDEVHLPRRSEVAALARDIGLRVVAQRYIVFFLWRGRVFDGAERLLAQVPLGAQYLVAASPTRVP
jgi:ubiquinone/menaquinone biosynthesis C-methylase UbiE